MSKWIDTESLLNFSSGLALYLIVSSKFNAFMTILVLIIAVIPMAYKEGKENRDKYIEDIKVK